jgi:hypothetical protein
VAEHPTKIKGVLASPPVLGGGIVVGEGQSLTSPAVAPALADVATGDLRER